MLARDDGLEHREGVVMRAKVLDLTRVLRGRAILKEGPLPDPDRTQAYLEALKAQERADGTPEGERQTDEPASPSDGH